MTFVGDVAKNTAAQLIGRGLSAITTFLVTLLVARQFGASGYGDFIKITTYAAFFYLVADFGMNAIYLQHRERGNWGSLVTLRVLGGIFLIFVAIIILTLLPGTQTQGYTPLVRAGILLFVPTILFQSLITTANAIFQKKLRYDLATWAIFFGSLVTVVLLFLSKTLITVVGVVAAGTLVTALLSLLLATRLSGPVSFSPTMKDLKDLFFPSIPLGITLLFNLVYFRADSVVITLTRPTAEVGVYGLAYKVFEVILVFPTFFMNAAYPLMLVNKNFRNILTRSFIFLFLISLLALGVVWFAAPLLVIIKNDFVQSIDALRILSLGLPFFFVTSATMWALVALKKQKILAVIYGISMLVNIVGNIILVPVHGFIAAAWMTVVGEAVVLLLSGAVIINAI